MYRCHCLILFELTVSTCLCRVKYVCQSMRFIASNTLKPLKHVILSTTCDVLEHPPHELTSTLLADASRVLHPRF